jgi:hypothetical protein
MSSDAESSGAGGHEHTFRFSAGGWRVEVGLPEVLAKLLMKGPPVSTDWKWFAPMEEKIVRLLLDGASLSREEIADKIDESPDGKIKGVLAELVERHVLSVQREGYRLNCSEEARPALKEWLGRGAPFGG